MFLQPVQILLNQLNQIYHSQFDVDVNKILAIRKRKSPEIYRYRSYFKKDIQKEKVVIRKLD
jgi:hypothetical protein